MVFLAYGGGMRWKTRAGDELAVNLGEPLTKDITAQAWRTALDPAGSGFMRCCAPPINALVRCVATFRRRWVGDRQRSKTGPRVCAGAGKDL